MAAEPASPWLARWAHLLEGRKTALDLAAGTGRHVRWLQAHGLHVTAVDRDADASGRWPAGTEALIADVENAAWPLDGRRFDAVIVTNYLWRPLMPTIVASLAPGGLLLYETFAIGQASVGRPTNPDFLLRPGELLQAAVRDGESALTLRHPLDGGAASAGR